MERTLRIIVAVLLIAAPLGYYVHMKSTQNDPREVHMNTQESKLAVLWTSGDRDVALKMVFMYTFNAKKNGWWDEIQFIVWGPSSKLLSEDRELQDYIKRMKDEGIELLACKACADSYGVSDNLTGLGIEVKYMGVPLTDLIKSGEWKTVTF
ncbi:DsrE family protein [candidate division KSB1 bacterium]